MISLPIYLYASTNLVYSEEWKLTSDRKLVTTEGIINHKPTMIASTPTVNNWSQDIYLKAYRFAAQAHQGQKFPGTDIDYIMHLSFVSMEVIAALSVETERDGNLAIQCAILHDTIEDTRITFADIKTNFGLSVANGVLALTKDDNLDKSLQMSDSLKRIKQQPPEIWMVKLADRISNLQTPPHYWQQDSIIRYRQEAIKIYESLKDASPFLAARLAQKIEEYKTFMTSSNLKNRE